MLVEAKMSALDSTAAKRFISCTTHYVHFLQNKNQQTERQSASSQSTNIRAKETTMPPAQSYVCFSVSFMSVRLLSKRLCSRKSISEIFPMHTFTLTIPAIQVKNYENSIYKKVYNSCFTGRIFAAIFSACLFELAKRAQSEFIYRRHAYLNECRKVHLRIIYVLAEQSRMIIELANEGSHWEHCSAQIENFHE